MLRNGVRQMDSTASIPKMPMAPFSTPAPANTVPVASEMMEPTTGTAVAMALRVICTVMASAAPVAAPVRVRKPVNTTMDAVSAQVTALLMPAPIFFRLCPGTMASAAAAAMQAYSSGSSSFRITVSSRLVKYTVATCLAPAEAIPPLAATAADSVGSNALANTSSSSMVSTPSPIIRLKSPAATSVMASAPAIGTNCGTAGCSAAAKKLSATLHSSTTPSSSAAPEAFSRRASPRYCRASCHRRDSPSDHAV